MFSFIGYNYFILYKSFLKKGRNLFPFIYSISMLCVMLRFCVMFGSFRISRISDNEYWERNERLFFHFIFISVQKYFHWRTWKEENRKKITRNRLKRKLYQIVVYMLYNSTSVASLFPNWAKRDEKESNAWWVESLSGKTFLCIFNSHLIKPNSERKFSILIRLLQSNICSISLKWRYVKWAFIILPVYSVPAT